MKPWWSEKLDAELFTLLASLPSFEFNEMVRQHPEDVAAAKQRFFTTFEPPVFQYRRAGGFDVLTYERALHRVAEAIESTQAPEQVKDLYREKVAERRERANLVAAIQHENDEAVTALSETLFGKMTISAEEHRREFEEMLSHADRFTSHTQPVTPLHFVRMMKRVLDHYRIRHWRLVLDNVPSMKIRHNISHGISTAYIPNRRNLSKARAARLLTHEIEVHALRTENGRKQPYAILGIGAGQYMQTEEGLAILFQIQLAKERFEHLPGFWDSWTVALAKETDFVTTFQTIAEAKQQLAEKKGEEKTKRMVQEEAWQLTTRVFRGITHCKTPHVCFSRDHVYRTGSMMMNQLLEREGEGILPSLFAGKIGQHDLQLVQSLGLTGRTPELVSKHIVAEVMKE